MQRNYRTTDSFGVEALDTLCGIGAGASIIHSLILLDENGTYGRYSKAIQRCFIAEGIDQKQDFFLSGPSSQKILYLLEKLPAKNDKKKDAEFGEITSNGDDFKIAWRYNSAPSVNSPKYTDSFTSGDVKFDLSRTDPNFDFQKEKEGIFIFNDRQPSLSELWSEIIKHITKAEYNQKNAKILRIVLNDLSSPYWSDIHYLPLFLAQLKSFCRHTNVIILLSLDSQLMKADLYKNCLQYMDVIFQLQKMNDQEQAKLYLRHRIDGGRFFVHKLPAINSAAPIHVPQSIDLLFSLRQSFFELKILHLPPAIGEGQSKMACQSFIEEF